MLWERVEAGGQRAEQRHREVLQLYTDLQQEQEQQEQLVTAQSGGDESWLEEQLEKQLRTRLDEERRQREQVRSWTRHHLERGSGGAVGSLLHVEFEC